MGGRCGSGLLAAFLDYQLERAVKSEKIVKT